MIAQIKRKKKKKKKKKKTKEKEREVGEEVEQHVKEEEYTCRHNKLEDVSISLCAFQPTPISGLVTFPSEIPDELFKKTFEKSK